jgi:hypothetical protein
MTENEREEALLMRQRLMTYLAMTHEQIIAYPHDANDEDYQFLIRKAIYYQELIDRLEQQLNADNE